MGQDHAHPSGPARSLPHGRMDGGPGRAEKMHISQYSQLLISATVHKVPTKRPADVVDAGRLRNQTCVRELTPMAVHGSPLHMNCLATRGCQGVSVRARDQVEGQAPHVLEESGTLVSQDMLLEEAGDQGPEAQRPGRPVPRRLLKRQRTCLWFRVWRGRRSARVRGDANSLLVAPTS